MKDPKRIERILKILKKVWEKNPSLRFTQLIGNCFPPDDNYFKDDEILEERLKEVYDV